MSAGSALTAPHPTAPCVQANNAVVRESGTPRQEEGLWSHVDLIQMLDIVNLEAGSAVAGGRGYYLTNEGPLLNQALINLAMHFGWRRGYRAVHTPFFMRQEIMAECAQLSQFDDELYKVTGVMGWLGWAGYVGVIMCAVWRIPSSIA